MSRRRRNGLVLLVLAFGMALVALLLIAGFNSSSDSGKSNAVEELTATPTATANPCEREDSFFELKYQKHTGGFVIDDGLPADPEAAKLKIAVVAAQDPTVLRYFANNVFAAKFPDDYGEISQDVDLTLLQNRKEEWQRLCFFMTDEKVIFVVIQLEAGEIENDIMSVDGNPSPSTSQATSGEPAIAIYIDGGEEDTEDPPVVLRALCSNLITKPPNDRPIVVPTATPTFTPTRTYIPTDTATLRPGETPPTATKTPTNTPTLRPGETRTPTKTFTPTNTPTRTNTPSREDTPTRTNTPVTPPTSTRTPTNTPQRPPTQTPAPRTPPCDCTPTNPDRPTNVPTAVNTIVVPPTAVMPTPTTEDDPQVGQTPVQH